MRFVREAPRLWLALYRLTFLGILLLVMPGFLMPGCAPIEPRGGVRNGDCVILLHGLGRGPSSMEPLAAHLTKNGYSVVNTGYPSTQYPVSRLAETYVPEMIRQCGRNGHKKIHFVTHSMGGIVIRQYLQNHQLPPGSRVVMLSPPNKGSELVDVFGGWFFFDWIYGPAGESLGTGPESLPNRLEPVAVEIGIIAGRKSFNPASWLIPGADDGRVSVKRTKLEKMKDFLVLAHSHNRIIKSGNVCRQVTAFLETGRFRPNRPASEKGDRS